MNVVVHRVSPQQARYTPAGGREKCSFCRFYIAPKWCGHVTGPVSPMGWCKYFSQEMRAQFGGSTVTSGIPAGATLALDFMSSGNLPAGITFTRASTGTYTDASGTIQTAAVNVPRWDYAAGVSRGLLIEEARTNLFLNSATLVTQSVAVTAQAYALSFYGTGTITKSGAATGALVGTGATQRVSQTFTPTAGTVTCTVTGSVTNAQIEAGAFATSWIPTAGATATRAQDTCVILPASMGWFTSPGGSWLAEFIFLDPAPANRRIISRKDFGGDMTPLFISSPPITVGQYDTIAPVQTTDFAVVNAISKAASTWAAGQAKACVNGGAVATSAALTNGYAPFATEGISFLTPPGNPTSGYLRRVQYWPRALSNAEMQQVTT